MLWAACAAVRLVDPNLRITRAPHAPQTWPQECPSALTGSRGQLAHIAMAKLPRRVGDGHRDRAGDETSSSYASEADRRT
jgi:hypothetical protein